MNVARSTIAVLRLRLLPCASVERLIAEAARPRGRVFVFRDSRFILRFTLRSAREVGFEWRLLDGVLYPSLRGTVRVVRFGPFALVTMRGSYAFEVDAPARLLRSALGDAPAKESLGGAVLAVLTLFKEAAAAQPRPSIR